MWWTGGIVSVPFWSSVFKFTLQPLCLQGKIPWYTLNRAVWGAQPVLILWCREKHLTFVGDWTGISETSIPYSTALAQLDKQCAVLFVITKLDCVVWLTGSSNSQDSFPAPGSSGTSMDGYGYGYPPGSTPDYSSPPMQRPASQTNAPSPHPG